MIDPKELRIGAHYYNGSYNEPIIGRVLSINGSINNPDDMSVGLIYDMPLDNDSDPYEAAMLPYLEPIPITEELLTELGFEKRKSGPFAKEYALNSWIFITLYATKELCKVNIYPSDPRKEASSVLGCYLHEIEQFLYLTTKTELIKE